MCNARSKKVPEKSWDIGKGFMANARSFTDKFAPTDFKDVFKTHFIIYFIPLICETILICQIIIIIGQIF